MRKLFTLFTLATLIAVSVCITGCTSLEKQAYRGVVGAKAFTLSISNVHPECGSRPQGTFWLPAHNPAQPCPALDRAITGKDLLIDAIEIYCGGGAFETGGPCNKPSGNAGKVAAEKLSAALLNYEQAETDLKALLGKAGQ